MVEKSRGWLRHDCSDENVRRNFSGFAGSASTFSVKSLRPQRNWALNQWSPRSWEFGRCPLVHVGYTAEMNTTIHKYTFNLINLNYSSAIDRQLTVCCVAEETDASASRLIFCGVLGKVAVTPFPSIR